MHKLETKLLRLRKLEKIGTPILYFTIDMAIIWVIGIVLACAWEILQITLAGMSPLKFFSLTKLMEFRELVNWGSFQFFVAFSYAFSFYYVVHSALLVIEVKLIDESLTLYLPYLNKDEDIPTDIVNRFNHIRELVKGKTETRKTLHTNGDQTKCCGGNCNKNCCDGCVNECSTF